MERGCAGSQRKSFNKPVDKHWLPVLALVDFLSFVHEWRDHRLTAPAHQAKIGNRRKQARLH